ncbi:ACT domain-containing protein [Photobacterium sanguinicancri]|uniref:ACT domain-containing protein n=1 Tax=Photobacterium sanguinicancri TaxID=875932 RepID=UPI0026E16C6C|nr:ACT domain-containing protein [Photobacterium sanguinicancri]MDO6499015.1 ACT domain-containing protein [Photobacterium sanguinicancri]
MAAITDLNELLKTMSPKVKADDYVFCTVTGTIKDYLTLGPIAFFHEDEGVTLVLKQQDALNASLPFDGIFKLITLTVHSSLEAVGLTAAVASKLASYDISANVIAAYYHDHIFVQKEKVDIAMSALAEFSGES